MGAPHRQGARRTLASVAFVGLLMGLAPAAGASDFAVPAAPTAVQAKVVDGGVRVSWTPSAANPPVTAYVVHAGQGSCPVRVPASATSAVMPVVKGQGVIRPQVQAVNALGYSVDAPAVQAVKVRGKASDRYRNLQVLQLSDYHGALEEDGPSIGASLLASAFARDRAAVPATVIVSAGDQFGGSPVLSAQFDELPAVDALNLMGIQVATMGNHEHDDLLPHLRRMIDHSNFAWVVSNYSTLEPLRFGKKKVTDFTIVDTDGLKVGVVGMNTEETADVVDVGNLNFGRGGRKEIVISPSPAPVNRSAAAARKAGADVVIGLLHQGWSLNVDGQPTGRLIDVTKGLRGVDLAFGGHTHQTFASIVNGIPVAQTRNAGIEYTRTQACIDAVSGKVVGAAVDYVTEADLAGLRPSGRSEAMIEGYAERLGARLDAVIGVVDEVFPRGGNPPVERSGETPMGTYLAEAMRKKYGTDFALLTGGGIRDTFPAAGYDPRNEQLRRPGTVGAGPYDVTLGDALSVFPFTNLTVTSTVTGANLWKALENGVSQYPGSGRFPQIAGLRFAFDPSRPVGSRVLSVTTADGRPIAADGRSYSIATTDFLVNGGDGYAGLFSPATAVVRDPDVDVLAEAIRSDTQAGGSVRPPMPDGRITRVG